ncbi:MAG: RNA 2',3'-cyclic phosphodiesterase [Anaerolineae bacterium]|nr:RNA 2',3'-cyclic phosphodiesterase [Anaerolineae bacterium]
METLRTFIAVDLAPALRGALGDLQARMQADVPPRLVRWVRPEGIHLTLVFLGDVPVVQVPAIAAALRTVCARHAPFSFSLGGTGCFPNVRRPRVVWVGVDEPTGALVRLQGDVERALQPLGYRPEQRRYTPHLTLGRVKGGSREAVEALGAYVARARVRLGEMDVDAVHLIRSELLPGGAVYTSLEAAPLGGRAASGAEGVAEIP